MIIVDSEYSSLLLEIWGIQNILLQTISNFEEIVLKYNNIYLFPNDSINSIERAIHFKNTYNICVPYIFSGLYNEDNSSLYEWKKENIGNKTLFLQYLEDVKEEKKVFSEFMIDFHTERFYSTRTERSNLFARAEILGDYIYNEVIDKICYDQFFASTKKSFVENILMFALGYVKNLGKIETFQIEIYHDIPKINFLSLTS